MHLPLSVLGDDGVTIEITPASADGEGADTSADDDSDTSVRAIIP
ncbi:hypothetical protein [Halalkalicoccus tibetensis]|uniref:Uncharacterized protein n=1 Tax=Halalkalicoccus tibetensis TaxID=175632 RepID=A0ABD5V2W3_9EURY